MLRRRPPARLLQDRRSPRKHRCNPLAAQFRRATNPPDSSWQNRLSVRWRRWWLPTVEHEYGVSAIDFDVIADAGSPGTGSSHATRARIRQQLLRALSLSIAYHWRSLNRRCASTPTTSSSRMRGYLPASDQSHKERRPVDVVAQSFWMLAFLTARPDGGYRRA